MRKIFYSICAFFCLAACSGNPGAEDQAEGKGKPNIVFLFTDDQTFASIQALGNSEIHTPNLDRLVADGTSFTHAYNMGGWNGAICVASRSMMISGSYIWDAQEVAKQWGKGDSTALEHTWPQLMEGAGYSTYMTGKWHVEAPADQVFQEARHIRAGMPKDNGNQLGAAVKKWKAESGDMKDWNDYMPLGYGRPKSPEDQEWQPYDTINGGFWKGGKHWSEVVRDDAIDFIQAASQKEDPFFMYLAFNAPHDPRQAPKEYIDMYPLEEIEIPESFLPEYPYKDDIGAEPTLRDEALAPFPRTEYAVKVHRQEYYAIISHLDEQIGKILDALEASGKLDNTYIFMTADHGLSVGNHGLIGKQSLYDHSIRVPLMVTGPGVPKGVKLDQEVYLQDIMASSLELAGIEKPSYVHFNSFMDIVEDNQATGHYTEIYGAYRHLQRMIRKDGYKLIVYPKINKVLLYDLNADPNEMKDLAADPAMKSKVNQLFDELLKLQQDMKDPVDLSATYKEVLG
ncbi:choline-sulfatase [Echinicola pacifica]|uniref:Choline-sulfatase n=1 Tax=Echinicola pacifica TaxID=346377 RepID=A0A918PJU9_9BACT|nr:sulfatase-like hydrolase/transferase [Echinicola pacifica]GGZ13354.1 choline-sulfatase [Echinicola pacifica]